MQEPLCIKCGGWLEHEVENDYWICGECGCHHVYVESLPSNELLELDSLSNMMKDSAGQVGNILQQFISIMARIDYQNQKYDSLSEVRHEISNTKLEFQNEYKLFWDTFHKADSLMEYLKRCHTPIGGRPF